MTIWSRARSEVAFPEIARPHLSFIWVFPDQSVWPVTPPGESGSVDFYARPFLVTATKEKPEPMMKKKLLFVAGAALGYVVGTRTGRQGYEKLKTQAGAVWQKPAVQDGLSRAEAFVEEKVPVVGSTVSSAVKNAADSISEAVKKNDSAGSSSDSDDTPKPGPVGHAS